MFRTICAGLLAATLFAGAAQAQTCPTSGYPNNLTNGTTADATQVMANFNCAALLSGANFTGNVGLNTTAPASLLDVNGNANLRGTAYLGAAGSANLAADATNIYLRGSGGVAFQNAGATATYSFVTSSTGNSYLNVAGGSVGVGTASPSDNLSVIGSGSPDLNVGNDTANNFIRIAFGSGIAAIQGGAWGGTTHPLIRQGGGGNVGIGTVSPGQPLTIEGFSSWGVAQIIGNGTNVESDLGFRSANISNGAAGNWLIGTNIGSSPTGAFTIWGGGLANALTITTAGVVDVADLAGAGNRAVYSDASGNLTNSSSDSRMKDKIVPLSSGLMEVEALKPVSFSWRLDLQPRLGKQREIGFLAQDVQKVVPEVVGANHDGMLSIDYPKLVAVLTKAVQEQQAEIAAQEAQIERLQALVAKIAPKP